MFERFAAFVDEMATITMDKVIGGGIDASLIYMRGALMLMVAIGAVLLIIGRLDIGEAARRGLRAAAVIAILQASAYNSIIRDVFWTTLPNQTASFVSGAPAGTTQAQRYAALNRQISITIGEADKLITGWGPSAWRASFSLSVAEACAKFFTTACFFLTILSRISVALLIEVGTFLMIALLFDSTRHIVVTWFGKLLGIALWSLLSNALTEMIVAAAESYAKTAATNNSMGMFGATDGAWMIALFMFCCFGVMLTLPALTAVGGGAAMSTMVANGAMVSVAARGMGGAASGAARTARRAAQVGRRAEA